MLRRQCIAKNLSAWTWFSSVPAIPRPSTKGCDCSRRAERWCWWAFRPVEKASFDIHHARRRELTFKNVRRQRGCVGPVIEMIESGRIDPRPMLTHRFPLEKIGEAFELVEGYRDGVIKAIIEI